MMASDERPGAPEEATPEPEAPRVPPRPTEGPGEFADWLDDPSEDPSEADPPPEKADEPVGETPVDTAESTGDGPSAPDHPDAPKSESSSDSPGRPAPYYCLDMFPYPSPSGFSVNQLRGIAITDVAARYQEALRFLKCRAPIFQ